MPYNFAEVLPDPNYYINEAGFGGLEEQWLNNVGYTPLTDVRITDAGIAYKCIVDHLSGASNKPGIGATWETYWEYLGPVGVVGRPFATIKLTDSQKIEQDRTMSGRVVTRSKEYARWMIDIKYNPMTREQFDPVYNFLMQKHGSHKPFYISLPQYAAPKDDSFALYVVDGSIGTPVSYTPGVTVMDMEVGQWASNDQPGYDFTGLPKAGDIFTLDVRRDTLHRKAYMVTHVETHLTYETLPITSCARVHFTPRLVRHLPEFTEAEFHNPLFKVRMVRDIQEYSLNTENLYSFSLRLEEALY
jgi:hypothetical protein